MNSISEVFISESINDRCFFPILLIQSQIRLHIFVEHMEHYELHVQSHEGLKIIFDFHLHFTSATST